MKTPRSYFCFFLLAASVAFPQLALAENVVYVSVAGSDTNSCLTVTAPCATLTNALSIVAYGGEVDILSDGNYDPVLIQQAVTIDAGGHHATISGLTSCNQASPAFIAPPGGTPVIPGIGAGSMAAICINTLINGTANDPVTLRGLTIAPVGTGFAPGSPTIYYGIVLGNGAGLRLEDVNIDGFAEPIAVGVYVQYGANTFHNLRITHAQNSGTGIGVLATGGANVNLTDSYLAKDDYGVVVQGGRGATAQLNRCVVSENTVGLSTSGGATLGGTIRIFLTSITDNTLGLQTTGTGGLVYSFGNNAIFGNTTNGSPSGTEPLK